MFYRDEKRNNNFLNIFPPKKRVNFYEMSNKKEPPKPQAQVPQPVPSKPGDPPAPNPEKKEEKKRGSQPSKAQAQIPQPVPPKPVDPPPEPEKKEEKKDEKKRGSYPLANEKMWFLKEPVDNRGRKNRIYFKDMEKSECAVICVGVAPKIVKLVDVIKENMTTRDVRINEIVPESLEIVSMVEMRFPIHTQISKCKG